VKAGKPRRCASLWVTSLGGLRRRLTEQARCAIKAPRVATAPVVWLGAWRGPIGIKPGRIYTSLAARPAERSAAGQDHHPLLVRSSGPPCAHEPVSSSARRDCLDGGLGARAAAHIGLFDGRRRSARRRRDDDVDAVDRCEMSCERGPTPAQCLEIFDRAIGKPVLQSIAHLRAVIAAKAMQSAFRNSGFSSFRAVASSSTDAR
jgi:hypothetical protein